MAYVQQSTVYSEPVSALSGRPPSDGGLNRGSRHVPVQDGSGSIFWLACVSLYETSVRYGVAGASVLRSPPVFPKTLVSPRKPQWPPAGLPASTFAPLWADPH